MRNWVGLFGIFFLPDSLGERRRHFSQKAGVLAPQAHASVTPWVPGIPMTSFQGKAWTLKVLRGWWVTSWEEGRDGWARSEMLAAALQEASLFCVPLPGPSCLLSFPILTTVGGTSHNPATTGDTDGSAIVNDLSPITLQVIK